jgi:hypothetical protein
MGESLALYLTGLGAVSPAVGDGAPGPSGTLSNATASIAVSFSGTAAPAPIFAGLAPGYSGLYQLNITVPAGLTVGDNYLNISCYDSSGHLESFMAYLLIPIGAPTASTAGNANLRAPATPAKPILLKPIKADQRLPGGK